MKFLSASVAVACIGYAQAWSPSTEINQKAFQRVRTFTLQAAETEVRDPTPLLTQFEISKLRFRELHRELSSRSLSTDGTTGQLRNRLKEAIFPDQTPECILNDDGIEDDCQPVPEMDGLLTFVDESDPDFEFNDLISQIESKAELGHWKTATRKLKRLTRHYTDVPETVFLHTLEACAADRLHAARASEPARKILEQMVEQGFEVPTKLGNYCIQNCLGNDDMETTHQGFGGLDTALAMKAALGQAQVELSFMTSFKLIEALAKDGSMDEAFQMLKELMTKEHVELESFAALADSISKSGSNEDVIQLLTLVTSAGYELENIAATEEGRRILASGIVAAEAMPNDALAFKLLNAAAKVSVEDEEKRGDALVTHLSSPVERACTLVHKRAIVKAVEGGQWQLAVKVLELMLERGLRPSKWLLRSIITCCAKAEKSRKATAVLLDWVKLYEAGKADQPPLSAFNTCVNVCEICGEEELTLMVLDQMRKSHRTDGNIITFNIALKRLAKLGNYNACEGIIIGMLQNKVEPTVVSYTTAIAACVSGEERNPAVAYQWLQRMRSRQVAPNVRTYNTALAACLDGTMDGTFLASKIAKEMMGDVERQLGQGEDPKADAFDVYHDVFPDISTRDSARQLLGQLKQNWMDNAIEKSVAEETVAAPLQQILDFEASEAAARVQALTEKANKAADSDQARSTATDEIELDYSQHRTAEV